MERFGPEPGAFFENVYRVGAPWDVGAPQEAMRALLDAYPPLDPVLDVGCGPGDLAAHIAGLGHQVVGVDAVDAAIRQAEERAAALPPETARLLTFRVADATRPSLLGGPFGSVVDSGFLHLLSNEETDGYLADVARALVPGGRLYLHEFAIEFPIPNVPRAVTEDEIRSRFTAEAGWRILDVHSAEFVNRAGPPAPAVAACLERL